MSIFIVLKIANKLINKYSVPETGCLPTHTADSSVYEGQHVPSHRLTEKIHF